VEGGKEQNVDAARIGVSCCVEVAVPAAEDESVQVLVLVIGEEMGERKEVGRLTSHK
jgi:hypothetical protein